MRLAPAGDDALLACLQGCRAFFEQVGQVPETALEGKPEGPCRKEVLGVFEGDGLVGVVDVLHGYPTPDVLFIGLLVLLPETRGRGLGRAVEQELVRGARESKVRLAVNFTNPDGKAFWASCGYRVTGQRPLRLAEDPTPTCWLMQKRLRWF